MIEAYAKELKNSLRICAGLAHRGMQVWREELCRVAGRDCHTLRNGAFLFEGEKGCATLLVARVHLNGFTVTNVDKDGFVWVDTEGRDAREWEHATLSLPGGERCALRAEVRYGEWSREDTEKTDALFADTGMRDAEKVRAMVRPGEMLYVAGDVKELLHETLCAPCAVNTAALALAFARAEGYPMAFVENEAQLNSVLELTQPNRVLFAGIADAAGALKPSKAGAAAVGNGLVLAGAGSLHQTVRDLTDKAGLTVTAGKVPGWDRTVSAFAADRAYLQLPVRFGSVTQQTVSARDAMCLTAIVRTLVKGEEGNA